MLRLSCIRRTALSFITHTDPPMKFARLIFLFVLLLLSAEAAGERRDSLQRRDSLRKIEVAERRDSLQRRDSLRKIEVAERRDSLQRRDSLRKNLAHMIHEEPTDSLSEARNQRLFDSIESKANRRKVTRWLYDLFVTERKTIAPTPTGAVVDQSQIYQPYHGRRISAIELERVPIFDENGNWFERTGNKLHWNTRERVIRRDFMIEPGDTLDPQEVVRNMQLLDSRSYISEVAVHVLPDSLNPNDVILRVIVRDKWSLSVDGRWGGNGETMVGVFDDNILGLGTRFDIETNFDRRDFSYGGNLLQYKVPNVGGSFFQAEIMGGREFKESTLHLSISKELLRPTDYTVGGSYIRDKTVYDEEDPDNIIFSRIKQSNFWGGISQGFKSINSSLYTILQFIRTRFEERPEVAFEKNPAFHERDELLASLGMYREKYLISNMIYGYGSREYIGSGYQAELVGGYHWGEYHNGYYFGGGLKGGGFRSWGYIYLGGEIGSYIHPSNGAWFRSVGKIDLKWFSNLINAGKFHIRELVKMNYTQGWNRMEGDVESINFNRTNGIRTLKELDGGTNRWTLNTETVLFTPYQPGGFRMTFFGFADFGVLGNNANPFQNEFFSAIGVGIRIKNERLIFRAIQLQLGVAFGKGGLLSDRWYRISNQRTVNEFRFRPAPPAPISFN